MNQPIRALAIAVLLLCSQAMTDHCVTAQDSDLGGIRRGGLTEGLISRGQLRRLLDQPTATGNPLRRPIPSPAIRHQPATQIHPIPQAQPLIQDSNVTGVSWQEEEAAPPTSSPDNETSEEDDLAPMIGPMPSPEMENRWREMGMLVEIPVNQLLQEVEERRTKLDTLVTIDPQSKTERLKFLEIAETAAHKANDHLAAKDSLQNRIMTLSEDLENLRRVAKAPQVPAKPDESLPVADMQVALRNLQVELGLQTSSLRKTQNRIQQRDDRMAAIPSERLESRSRMNELHEELLQKQAAGSNEVEELLSLRAGELAASTKVQLLDEEDHWLDLSQEKLPLEKSIHQRNIQRLELEIESWNTHIANQKQRELEQQIAAARQNAYQTHPTLREFSLETTKLTQERVDLATKIGKLQGERQKVEKQKQEVEQHLERLKRHEEALVQGGNEQSNAALIEVHRKLTRPWESMARIRTLESLLVLYQGSKEELRQQQDLISDPTTFIREQLEIVEDQRVANTTLVAMAETAIENQREQLFALEGDYDDLLGAIGDIKTTRIEMLKKIAETREIIDTHALWVQSADPLDMQVLKKSRSGAVEFFDRDQWDQLGSSIVWRVKRRPWEPAVGMLGLFTAFLIGRRFKG